jgi:hypothetical protein
MPKPSPAATTSRRPIGTRRSASMRRRGEL